MEKFDIFPPGGTVGAPGADFWVADPNTWTFSSTDGPTSVVTVNANITGTVQVGDRIKFTNGGVVKYFIVHAISFSSPNTTVTLYGGRLPVILNASHANAGGAVTSLAVLALPYAIPSGATLTFENGDTTTTSASAAVGAVTISITSTTPSLNTNGVQTAGWVIGQHSDAIQFLVANSAITSPAYSHAKDPFGFNADRALWTETVTTTEGLSVKSSSVAGTWYNGVTISVPIGAWDLGFQIHAQCQMVVNNAVTATFLCRFSVALSTANNTASDPELEAAGGGYIPGLTLGGNTVGQGVGEFTKRKSLTQTVKTTWFMNIQTIEQNANAVYTLFFYSVTGWGAFVINAVSSYL